MNSFKLCLPSLLPALFLPLSAAIADIGTNPCGSGTVPAGWHAQSATGPFDAVPVLSSRPTASHVLFLDFDGGSIAASPTKEWNCGFAFTVNHSGLSAAEMRRAYEAVKEDFLPFRVDVTTDESRYLSAAPGQRMRCLITPTDAWWWKEWNCDPQGGRAVTHSFRDAGVPAGAPNNAADTPCFVFITTFDPVTGRTTENGKNLAGAISHEFGHTLGLWHDGVIGDPNGVYIGHGTGPTPRDVASLVAHHGQTPWTDDAVEQRRVY